MKKSFLLTLTIVLFSLSINAQTYNGIIHHTHDYFTMYPFSSGYDDGSFAKIFYDGNNKTINFWNSDSSTSFTSIKVGSVTSYDGNIVSTNGSVSGRLNHRRGYFTIEPYDSGYDDGSFANIFYDGNKKRLTFWNSDSGTDYTSIKVGKIISVGTIYSKEVQVSLDVPADYVFEKYYTGESELNKEYVMPTLEEVEAYTKANNHLPEMPSAQEIKENGLKLKEMTNLLLQKIEELTLYTIEQEKRIKALEAKLNK